MIEHKGSFDPIQVNLHAQPAGWMPPIKKGIIVKIANQAGVKQ